MESLGCNVQQVFPRGVRHIYYFTRKMWSFGEPSLHHTSTHKLQALFKRMRYFSCVLSLPARNLIHRFIFPRYEAFGLGIGDHDHCRPDCCWPYHCTGFGPNTMKWYLYTGAYVSLSYHPRPGGITPPRARPEVPRPSDGFHLHRPMRCPLCGLHHDFRTSICTPDICIHEAVYEPSVRSRKRRRCMDACK